MELRRLLCETAKKLIGIKYEFGSEWTNHLVVPKTLDCSEMIEGIFDIVNLKMPDGSQNQYNQTYPIEENYQIGDLAFFGRGKDQYKIYHVGMVYFNSQIIEARAFDKTVSFKTGEVICRPLEAWKNYKNFCGFRSHPKLI